MDLGLQDVHVLITGASGGIGSEAARLFLSLGAKVTAHYNSKTGLLDDIDAPSAYLAKLQADLTNQTDVQALFANAAAQFGPVTCLVVNHAAVPPELVPVADMSLDRWQRCIDANLTSPFLVAREFLKGLREAGKAQKDKASIVFVGSTAGVFGEANRADYAAAKSGVMYGLPLSLKNEIVKFAPLGRVNCVSPGYTRTPRVASALEDPNLVGRALATTPLKKVAEPKDIAHQIAILSSSVVSGHVSGQIVMVAGGMEGRMLNSPEDLRS